MFISTAFAFKPPCCGLCLYFELHFVFNVLKMLKHFYNCIHAFAILCMLIFLTHLFQLWVVISDAWRMHFLQKHVHFSQKHLFLQSDLIVILSSVTYWLVVTYSWTGSEKHVSFIYFYVAHSFQLEHNPLSESSPIFPNVFKSSSCKLCILSSCHIVLL